MHLYIINNEVSKLKNKNKFQNLELQKMFKNVASTSPNSNLTINHIINYLETQAQIRHQVA